MVRKAAETSTYSWSRSCTVNCRPTASNYQLSHLRSGREPNLNLKGGRQECYHSAAVAPARSLTKTLSSVGDSVHPCLNTQLFDIYVFYKYFILVTFSGFWYFPSCLSALDISFNAILVFMSFSSHFIAIQKITFISSYRHVTHLLYRILITCCDSYSFFKVTQLFPV